MLSSYIKESWYANYHSSYRFKYFLWMMGAHRTLQRPGWKKLNPCLEKEPARVFLFLGTAFWGKYQCGPMDPGGHSESRGPLRMNDNCKHVWCLKCSYRRVNLACWSPYSSVLYLLSLWIPHHMQCLPVALHQPDFREEVLVDWKNSLWWCQKVQSFSHWLHLHLQKENQEVFYL